MKDTETTDSLHIIDEDLDVLSELRHKLEAELEKPDTELDVETINRITKEIEKVTGSEQITAEKTQQGIQRLKQELHQQNRRSRILLVKWIAACACFILIVSNIWSYSAYGLNSFSAAYKLISGGINIDFQQDVLEPDTGNLYFEEMSSICQQHNLNILIPTYLPNGFKPTSSNGEYDENEKRRKITFYYSQQKAKLNLSVFQYATENDIPPRGIPSDSYNISKQKFGETIVYIQKEKKQYWAVFQISSTQYMFYADKLDYDECQRVLESMFETNS